MRDHVHEESLRLLKVQLIGTDCAVDAIPKSMTYRISFAELASAYGFSRADGARAARASRNWDCEFLCL